MIQSVITLLINLQNDLITSYLTCDTVMAHTKRWQELLNEMKQVTDIYNLIAFFRFFHRFSIHIKVCLLVP